MEKDRIQQILERVDSSKGLKGKDVNIEKDFLIIDIDSGLLAIQIEYLREVLDIQAEGEVAIIPFTPEYIRGIINLRDEVIPVLSLSIILNQEGYEEKSAKLMVIEFKGIKLAFPVLSIIDLRPVNIQKIHAIKDVTRKSAGEFIREEFVVDQQRVGVLDIIKFYASEYVC